MIETTSKISSNNPNVSSSLRVTIPRNIVEILKITSEDSLDWIVSSENDEMKVCVKKSE